ncbi:MAG: hypothetical protein QW352_02430 [Candidatus Methanomethylicia archaeon]
MIHMVSIRGKILKLSIVFYRLHYFISEFFPLLCLLVFTLFLSGFNLTLLSPITGLFPTSFGYSFIIPYMDYQTVVEFIVVFLLILLSSVGLILILHGSRISIDRRFSNIVSYGGVLLFILMSLILQYIFNIKFSGT